MAHYSATDFGLKNVTSSGPKRTSNLDIDLD